MPRTTRKPTPAASPKSGLAAALPAAYRTAGVNAGTPLNATETLTSLSAAIAVGGLLAVVSRFDDEVACFAMPLLSILLAAGPARRVSGTGRVDCDPVARVQPPFGLRTERP